MVVPSEDAVLDVFRTWDAIIDAATINGSSAQRFSSTNVTEEETTAQYWPRCASSIPEPTIGITSAGPSRIDAISPLVGRSHSAPSFVASPTANQPAISAMITAPAI